MRILLAGLSTRAIAESTLNCAYEVVTLDYFGDRDQRALVENHALLRDFSLPFGAEHLLQASRELDYDAVVYISNLENHPEVVEEMAQGRVLLGNDGATLRQVRDWGALRTFCREASIPFAPTLLPGEEEQADPAVQWLRKPMHSGGGHGIRPWTGGALDRAHLLQAYIEGQPGSAAFVANGQRSVVFGLSEQLVGREELGADGFTWCGNILPLAAGSGRDVPLLNCVEEVTTRLTRRFGLRGVNGIDFIVADGIDGLPRPTLVEINPRYTASMELAERAYGLGVFSMHIEGISGRLPRLSLSEHLNGGYQGKGIVYARRTVTMPETQGWVGLGRRDVPYPGERIEAGHPICTVLTQGKTRSECWQRLVEAVEAVREETGDLTE